MSADGITNSNRVEHTTERKLYAKVVDNVLSSRTLFARIVGNGKPFMGKTMDFTIKITDSAQGEFYTGVEALNSSASDTTIQLSYAHYPFSQPVVLPFVDLFANTGKEATIDLAAFKMEEAGAEAIQNLGSAIYGLGGTQINGLGALVDDATDVTTVGGQSRSTYAVLKATRTASGGTVSLSKLATLFDNCSAAGIQSEEPTLGVTTKTVWSLLESLYTPFIQASYNLGTVLPVRASSVQKEGAFKGMVGFNYLTFRGVPIIKDDACTSGNVFFLNENYLNWHGRSIVPEKLSGKVEKVDLGTPSTMEGAAVAPSAYNGFFYQKEQVVINQAGLIGRLHVYGQLVTSQPRRHGRLTGITSI
jgi:hypothetical protein